MPKLTEEQISQERSVDLLDYLQAHEPGNVRKSKGSANEYYMVEHVSLKMSNGKWFRHSTQYGGYCHYLRHTHPDLRLLLCENNPLTLNLILAIFYK